ncbi:TonB-dependent receptor domain-containing protein [Providencia alcalifaciens]|uniref:TonB-dependent receptor domain-containing protein n=1 Tax=Providencia alcalifaciens TaxID=126385 RepID=UPI0004517F3D|nr:TonB-dependent receptor [Providencia alcalifaciens]ETT09285.1 putative siderophore receptor IreA [Providencia alcalifaciens F90-2004]EUC97490.1 putative siderophore receptor IreA [Providencia alcalifaciens PAL-2]MTB31938.1 TonB-dependent receptor [Providencia alcalifaciens]MTC98079.1 TonB-dependent receptor [Providencia alcalifaciens]
MKKHYHYSLLAAGVCAAIASFSATAEENSDKMIVTASGYSQQLRDAPASVTVITAEQLQNKPVRDLADAVKDVEGVSVVGSANKQDINIRGLSGEYTLILVDGRRQNSRESRPNGSGGFEAGFMPPVEAIERIEVIRGPMSSLYGSDAMGGVINIITKKVTNEWHGSVTTGAIIQENSESGDSMDGNFYLSGPLIKDKLGLQLYGGGDYRKEDHIIDGHNKKDNKSLTAKLTFTPMENQTFLLEAGRTTQERTETPGESIGEYANRAGLQKNNKDETHNNRNHMALTYKGDWDIVQTEMSVYQEQTKRSIKSQSRNKITGSWEGGYEARTPEITNTVVDGKVTAFLPDNILTAGTQYQHAKLKDTSATGSKSTESTSLSADQYALFLEDEFTATENLILTGGIRLDHHEFYGDHWNPRGYAIYHLTDEITIKGGVSQAFRAPTLREISRGYGTSTQGGKGIIYGNPDLKPEKSFNQEIGIAYDHESGFNASLMFFNTDFKNKLTSYDTGKEDPITKLKLYTYDNVGEANIKGVEIAAGIPFAEDWNLSLNYTYTDSERKSNDEKLKNGTSLKGYPLDKTPKHLANAKLDWQYSPDLNLYTRAHYEGEQVWAAQRNGSSVPRYRKGYTTMDVGATYQLLKNTKLNFAVLNIANEKGSKIDAENGGNWDVEDGRRYWANVNVTF